MKQIFRFNVYTVVSYSIFFSCLASDNDGGGCGRLELINEMI